MAGSLKLELAQFREVERFAKLGFTLDEATTGLLNRGYRFTQLLVQKQNNPFTMDKQVLFFFSALEGYIDWMPLFHFGRFEYHFLTYYTKSVFEYPLHGILTVKNNKIDEDVAHYLFWHFTDNFIIFLAKHYGFKPE